MYLTAQHVLSPRSQREGVNAFLYRHGSRAWDSTPPAGVPDQNPGTLVAQSISVPPPGNRVRSYLDIVAPDEYRWPEIRLGLMEFVNHAQGKPLPWEAQSGRCLFRLGLDSELSSQWLGELAVLYRATQALWLANPH